MESQWPACSQLKQVAFWSSSSSYLVSVLLQFIFFGFRFQAMTKYRLITYLLYAINEKYLWIVSSSSWLIPKTEQIWWCVLSNSGAFGLIAWPLRSGGRPCLSWRRPPRLWWSGGWPRPCKLNTPVWDVRHVGIKDDLTLLLHSQEDF